MEMCRWSLVHQPVHKPEAVTELHFALQSHISETIRLRVCQLANSNSGASERVVRGVGRIGRGLTWSDHQERRRLPHRFDPGGVGSWRHGFVGHWNQTCSVRMDSLCGQAALGRESARGHWAPMKDLLVTARNLPFPHWSRKKTGKLLWILWMTWKSEWRAEDLTILRNWCWARWEMWQWRVHTWRFSKSFLMQCSGTKYHSDKIRKVSLNKHKFI